MIEEKTDIPVLGAVPMADVDIDDEDSLSERLLQTKIFNGLDIAVIRVPHISNFTDFTPFERMEGVSLRYVSRPFELEHPDLIILPGTKNTMDDLSWLRQSGLEGMILRCHEAGTPIVGICGGFQMLGQSLEDPFGVERTGAMRGWGF